METDIYKRLQDLRTVEIMLLLIEEALQTKALPKDFLFFNDESLQGQWDGIKELMGRLGVSVPEQ